MRKELKKRRAKKQNQKRRKVERMSKLKGVVAVQMHKIILIEILLLV